MCVCARAQGVGDNEKRVQRPLHEEWIAIKKSTPGLLLKELELCLEIMEDHEEF